MKLSWTALVLAAGKGTRMKSSLPKVLHGLLGRPMLAWVLDAVEAAGVDATYAVVGHEREKVVEQIAPLFPRVQYVTQGDQKGTGHAVMCAREELAGSDATILIVSGDTPLIRASLLQDVMRAHEQSGAAATLVAFDAANPAGYGRMVRKGKQLERVVEEKDATAAQKKLTEVNAGTYAVSARELFAALETVSANNAQGEYYLPDIVPALRKRGKRVEVYVASDETDFRGINHRAELAELSRILQDRRNLELMLSGVTMEDPRSTYVAAGVSVGPDTVLEPGARLLGRTRVGVNCRIGAGSVLEDSEVGDGATILPYSVIEGAKVGGQTSVGPFAHLRAGAVLARGSRVGNFVEIKNARLGERSKALHLTYLGDANIGAGTNVGAGTITCNYDGQTKHHTEIGDDCFIGSDSILVAPIEVGSGAYVAAGSTVTRNVPPRALAISRARQENKEGYRDVLERRRNFRSETARSNGSNGGTPDGTR